MTVLTSYVNNQRLKFVQCKHNFNTNKTYKNKSENFFVSNINKKKTP